MGVHVWQCLQQGNYLRNVSPHADNPASKPKIPFIHGDFRTANIMVQYQPGGQLEIPGLIDWEMSGFYPEDLECVKALNNLSPIATDD